MLSVEPVAKAAINQLVCPVSERKSAIKAARLGSESEEEHTAPSPAKRHIVGIYICVYSTVKNVDASEHSHRPEMVPGSECGFSDTAAATVQTPPLGWYVYVVQGPPAPV